MKLSSTLRDKGAVRRAVVDHDDLEVAAGLREDAVQRLPELGQHVVDGRHHAHEGACVHALGTPSAVRGEVTGYRFGTVRMLTFWGHFESTTAGACSPTHSIQNEPDAPELA